MSAREVIAAELDAQGCAFPNAAAELILGRLKKSGYAVVELPKPDEDGSWRVQGTDLEVSLGYDPSDGPELRVTVDSIRSGARLRKTYDPSVGPDLAAALLAAAAEAS